MLGKLLKYEFKATGRTFLPMYALLVVMAFVNKFFFSSNMDYFKIPQIISMTVFVVVIVGISVMTLIITIQRFNKNLLTDEGYLSFTLPVKAHTHIDAKMIASFVWTVLSVIVSLIAVFILIADHDTMTQMGIFFSEMSDAVMKIGSGFYVILLESILLVVLGTMGNIVEIYLAITVGNMSSKHKLLAGVGTYLGIGIIEQIVVSIVMTSVGPNLEPYFENFNRYNMVQDVHIIELTLLALIVYTLIFSVASYVLTNWMLTKKLNLE